ncbi:uncharacterized protein LOC128890156 [Hylaeus anthracinus]|uniref:uncharacterized protein LOC128890156 n=1 Tax=Hylaeus anthracinus TaxID=313031 RepID=UPI0023B8B68D|nr:uncharacterized protein LOC128890156 [Hylaeus anthracinus]
MTADILSPKPKSTQPLKKRKIEINCISNDDLSNNVQTSQETHNNKECVNKETLKSPNKKDITNENVQTINNNQNVVTNVTDNTENAKIKETHNNDRLSNSSQRSFISIRKLEDLRFIPPKNTELNELIDVKSIKAESPDLFSPCTLNSNSVVKSISENYYPNENNTPSKRRKRKISNSDYDQLSDILKSELYDANVYDMEPIDMLHDLDSVMDFEETKISSEFLSSITNDTMQNEQNIEMSKDPQIDPLFIANSDVQSTTNEDMDIKQINNLTDTKYNLRKNKTSDSINTDESINDEAYHTIKYVLGELDIHSDAENEESLKNATKRLYDLKVQIIHDIPPQHKIEHTAGSRPLTKEERHLFLKYGPIKNGVFSPKEDETIKNNWKTFCKIHKWNPEYVKPFLYMRHGGSQYFIKSMIERQKFVQFLANGLPWRTLHSVHRRFRSMNEKYAKSFRRYTVQEDEQILTFMKNKHRRKQNHKLCDIAKTLGRTSQSVWLRYQLLKKMQKRITDKPLTEVKWTLPLIGTFIETIMDVTLSETVEDLKDAVLPKPVWLKIQEKLNIDHNVLKVFWMHQLHMQLFCPEPIYLNDIKIKLIEYMYGKGISNTREILWPNVAKYFEGVTTVFLCKVFFHLVKKAITKIGTNDLLDIVDHLYFDKISDIKNDVTDKFLPRLSYTDGKVKIIDKDMSDNVDTE